MGFREHLGDAKIVNSETSCIHEIMLTSAAHSHEKLVFTNIAESPGHKVALNLLTRERLSKSFGIEESDLIDILAAAMNNRQEPVEITPASALALECGQDEVDLLALPIPWHYSEDRGRYMSASIIIAEYQGQRNVSFHRQFIRDSTHIVARLVPRHLRDMVDLARKNGDTIPIVIVNSPDPTVLLCAAMSFDEPIDELTVAATLHENLNGTPLELVRMSNGVLAPAHAEYLFEATITLEDDDEGPYVDITGTLDDVRKQPVIEVHNIHHRKDPVFHGLIPAEAEHKTLMGVPRAPTIKNAVSQVVECVDVYLTEGGCGWLSSVVSIIPKKIGDGRRAIEAALAGHRSMKQVTIVDADINVGNAVQVEWAMMTRWQPDKDTIITSNQKGSSLDPSRNSDGTTAKIGFDATLPPGVDMAPYTAVR